MSSASPESFQPPPHRPPDTLVTKLLFSLRLFADFQVRTAERVVRLFLKDSRGKIADIGCGMSPYRHLFECYNIRYLGVDTVEAGNFLYHNPSIITFDGQHLPFKDSELDGFICTEVLEHLEDPSILILELHRVLKPGGRGLFTVPWSARYHYIPFDYARYTPARLKQLCSSFSSVDVQPRGTDITVIAAKTVVLFLRQCRAVARGNILAFLPAVLTFPFVLLALLVGHGSLLFHAGSKDDPLGYAVLVQKEG